MKTIRTYLSGCTWCNAKGFVNNPMGYVVDTTIICPVCNGAKTILVTEEYDTLYEIDCSNVSTLIPNNKLK